jgi:hypothetical protein
MRGGDRNTGALFSYVSCEARVAKSHPLRAIRQIVDAALLALSPDFPECAAMRPNREKSPDRPGPIAPDIQPTEVSNL